LKELEKKKGSTIQAKQIREILRERSVSTDDARIILRRLRQYDILLDVKYLDLEHTRWLQQIERCRAEFHRGGTTVVRDLLPKSAFHALRTFYRRIHGVFGGFEASKKKNMQKYNWNDEPVARFYNVQITHIISLITQEPLTSAGLALSIWVMKGDGFPLHTDSSPPFDVTLDIVVDHGGSEDRPITLLRPKGKFVVEEETHALHLGDAVLFKGAEMTHFGHDMFGDDSYHNVILWTWNYVRAS